MFLQKSHLIWNLSEILWRCTMVVQPHISNTHYVIRHRNYLRNSSAETFIKQPSATTRHQLGRIVSRWPGPVRCTMLRLFGPVRSSDRGDRGGGGDFSLQPHRSCRGSGPGPQHQGLCEGAKKHQWNRTIGLLLKRPKVSSVLNEVLYIRGLKQDAEETSGARGQSKKVQSVMNVHGALGKAMDPYEAEITTGCFIPQQRVSFSLKKRRGKKRKVQKRSIIQIIKLIIAIKKLKSDFKSALCFSSDQLYMSLHDFSSPAAFRWRKKELQGNNSSLWIRAAIRSSAFTCYLNRNDIYRLFLYWMCGS